MSPSFGMAAGGGPHAPPQRGAIFHQWGPFTSILTPTLMQKVAGDVPRDLWVGLLAKPPNPDGHLYEELEMPGYERQLVARVSDSTLFHTIETSISFHFAVGVAVKHVGLFDAQGSLCFYGAMTGQMVRMELPRDISFPARCLKLKRFRAPEVGSRTQVGGPRLHS